MEIKSYANRFVVNGVKETLILLGRIFFSLIFIIAGFEKIIHFTATANYLSLKAVPYSWLFLVLSIIIELGGGLMLFIGWRTRLASLLLIFFIVPVTFVFHSFWTFEQASSQNQMHHFMKNLSIMGGALYILAFGGGKFSLDNRRKKTE